MWTTLSFEPRTLFPCICLREMILYREGWCYGNSSQNMKEIEEKLGVALWAFKCVHKLRKNHNQATRNYSRFDQTQYCWWAKPRTENNCRIECSHKAWEKHRTRGQLRKASHLEKSGAASPTVVAAVCRCSCLGQWLGSPTTRELAIANVDFTVI